MGSTTAAAAMVGTTTPVPIESAAAPTEVLVVVA